MKTQPTITPDSQQGATLIVVLLVLVLIILAGAIVVRKSNTDLRLATASQVDSLLFIAAEQPNAKLEQQAKAPNSNIFSSTKGLMGYFMSEAAEANANHELVLCYQPKVRDSLALFRAGILQPNSTDPLDFGRLDGNGDTVFCNVNDQNSYTSGRNAAMVQMAITRGTPSGTTDNVALNTDLHNARARNYSLNVDSASSIPAYGSAGDTTINDCYKKPLTKSVSANIQIVSECLSEAGIPNKTVTQNYIAQYQESDPESSDTLTRGSVVSVTSSGSDSSGSDSGDGASTESGSSESGES